MTTAQGHRENSSGDPKHACRSPAAPIRLTEGEREHRGWGHVLVGGEGSSRGLPNPWHRLRSGNRKERTSGRKRCTRSRAPETGSCGGSTGSQPPETQAGCFLQDLLLFPRPVPRGCPREKRQRCSASSWGLRGWGLSFCQPAPGALRRCLPRSQGCRTPPWGFLFEFGFAELPVLPRSSPLFKAAR